MTASFVGCRNTTSQRLHLSSDVRMKKEQFGVTKKLLFSAVSSFSTGAEGRIEVIATGMQWFWTARG